MTTLVRGARVLPLGDREEPRRAGDVLISAGEVTAVDEAGTLHEAEVVLDADGRWLGPALWDGHVHLTQWGLTTVRLDLAPARSVEDALGILADHLAAQAHSGMPRGSHRADGTERVVTGWGHRSVTWPRQPTVAELDRVAQGRPVVLISGDGHHGWLSSRALELLGQPPRDGIVDEAEWFALFARLGELPGATDDAEEGVRRVATAAAAMGIVGVVDLEFEGTLTDWPARVAAGVDQLRVRAGYYPEALDAALALGRWSGMPLDPERDPEGLVTLGPLKLISDGSLNTRTAYCCEPYADAAELDFPRGKQNYSPDEMRELLSRATQSGLECAVHAIGDAAVSDALDAFEATGARGSIEHAQLMRWDDVPRLARLGLRASVQPAHLLDDRDVTMQCWPDRADRCFPFRRMLDVGVRLVLGSDAPVSPLDPWLAMAAAVHRSADGREAWHGEQALTPQQAYAASTDGQGSVAVGSRGDLVLLDDDPFAAGSPAWQADRLRRMSVAATLLGGRVTHRAL